MYCIVLYRNNRLQSGTRKGQLSEEATRNLMACFLWVVKNVDQHILHTWWSDMSMARLNQIIDVLYFCVSIFEYKVSDMSQRGNCFCTLSCWITIFLVTFQSLCIRLVPALPYRFFRKGKKGMFLYSTISSPLDRSKRFTLYTAI